MTKKICIILLIFSLFSCNDPVQDRNRFIANSDFSIDGIVKGLKNGTVLILEIDKISDTTYISKERFRFTGRITENAKEVILRTKDSKLYKFFWLENRTLKFTADSANFRKAKITGSKTHLLAAQLDSLTAKQEDLIIMFSNQIDKTDSKKSKLLLIAKINVLQSYVDNENMRFIKNYPNSPISVNLLETYSSTWGTSATKKLFSLLSVNNKNSSDGKDIQKYLMLNKKIAIGKKYANFIQYDPKGFRKELSQFIGQPLLLEFWASWCAPCRTINPELKKVYQRFHNKQFEIISVSVDRDKGKWLEAINKDKLPWVNLSERDGGENNADKVYGITHYPSNVLLDKQGIIIAIDIQIDTLNKVLSKILTIK